MAKKKNTLTAKTADKNELYQWSVQSPEFEIGTLDGFYKKHYKKKALSMREDFCGSAYFCAEWVKSDPKRTATGVDLDPHVLKWGEAYNLKPLGKKSSKVKLVCSDVRKVPGKDRFDMITAFNYSSCYFYTRKELLAYVTSAKESLSKDGMFVIDLWGGWESQELVTDKRKVSSPKGSFIYVWRRPWFNPINNRYLGIIDFKFKDGTKIKNAFQYEFRVWSTQELLEIFHDAGFPKVDLMWEGEDKKGEGTGKYKPESKAVNCPSWCAYVVGYSR